MNAVETRGIKKYFGSGETRVEALRETDFEARFVSVADSIPAEVQ